MAEMYEVLAEPPLAIATVIDRHRDNCPRGCTEHKHERVDVELGGTFDAAHLDPRTNVDALVHSGLIREVKAAEPATGSTPDTGSTSDAGAAGQAGKAANKSSAAR